MQVLTDYVLGFIDTPNYLFNIEFIIIIYGILERKDYRNMNRKP